MCSVRLHSSHAEVLDGNQGTGTFGECWCSLLSLKPDADLQFPTLQEDVVMFMQKLPTSDFGVKDVEEILSQAYIYQTAFQAAPSHLG